MFYSIFIAIFYYGSIVRHYLYHMYTNVLLHKYTQLVHVAFALANSMKQTQEKNIRSSVSKENVSTVTSITTLSEKYISVKTERFLKTYETENQEKYNENVDAIFYEKQKWTELMKDENNYLEKKWQTKILLETTPRGNIYMWYDAYKLGFVYYSDQPIPYSLLNAVAMKYVMVFCCRDFFMDELVLKNKPPSKIAVNHKQQTQQQTTQLSAELKYKELYKTVGSDNTNDKKGPFAKFKTYNNVSSKVKNAKKNELHDNQDEEKQTNRFVRLGKTRNISFLQKMTVTKKPYIMNKCMNSALATNGIYSIFTQNPQSHSEIADNSSSISVERVCTNESGTSLLPTVPEHDNVIQPQVVNKDSQSLSYLQYKQLLKSKK